VAPVADAGVITCLVTEHNKKAKTRVLAFSFFGTGLEHRGGKPTYIIAGDIIKYFQRLSGNL